MESLKLLFDGKYDYYNKNNKSRPLEVEYRRINNISDDDWLNMDYDEEDDSVTAEMRASISEARQKRALEDENRDKVSGPAFDENLKNATEALGPDGSSRFIAGKEGG